MIKENIIITEVKLSCKLEEKPMLVKYSFFLSMAEKWSASCCFHKMLLKYQKFCTWHINWVAWLTASLIDDYDIFFKKKGIHESNQIHQLYQCWYNKKTKYKLHKTFPCWTINPPKKWLSISMHCNKELEK